MAASRISLIGSGSAEATTVTIPAGHQLGDVMLIFAGRDGNTTAPSLPTGWTSLMSGGANLVGYRAGYKIATSGAESSGTWTNATGLMVHVYRGPDPTTPFGTNSTNSGSSATLTYGSTQGVSLDRMDNQWFVAFAIHQSIDTTTMTTAPTGYTIVITALGATQDMVSFDTNGPVQAGAASNNVATGGTSAGYRTIQFPIYPPMMAQNNYLGPRSISAGVISVSEKIR